MFNYVHKCTILMIAGMSASFQTGAATAQGACNTVLTAETAAGAMVTLNLSSPCHAGSEFVLHHSGLMVSEVLDGAGTMTLDFPAMNTSALFMIEFPDGEVVIASTDVPSLSFYDRVAIQWQGAAGLELHAREFGAAYGSEGHVWRGAPRSMDYAALGEGGFLVELGRGDAETSQLAEFYTFPSATTRQNGVVSMSVEAVIEDGNCGRTLEAMAIKAAPDGNMTAKELTVEMPTCDAVGDILLLNNLVEDLIIGSN